MSANDGLRNLTKDEMIAHFGDQLRQASPEEIARLRKLRQELMAQGYSLPPTPSYGLFDIDRLLGF